MVVGLWFWAGFRFMLCCLGVCFEFLFVILCLLGSFDVWVFALLRHGFLFGLVWMFCVGSYTCVACFDGLFCCLCETWFTVRITWRFLVIGFG